MTFFLCLLRCCSPTNLKYDCESEIPCKNPGPFLAGINQQACSAQGGTWCPAKLDCSVLKNCIDAMADQANAEDRLAFEQYLREAPDITDTTDVHECGSLRNYLGFDEFFINDAQICEDVEQLKFSRDFDFLDEFFKQGSDGWDSGDGSSLELTPPDRSELNGGLTLVLLSELSRVQSSHLHEARSTSKQVASFKEWMSKIQGLDWVIKGFDLLISLIEAIQCFVDAPFHLGENICKQVKSEFIKTLIGIKNISEKVRADRFPLVPS